MKKLSEIMSSAYDYKLGDHSLFINNSFIVTCREDGTIKLINYETEEYFDILTTKGRDNPSFLLSSDERYLSIHFSYSYPIVTPIIIDLTNIRPINLNYDEYSKDCRINIIAINNSKYILFSVRDCRDDKLSFIVYDIELMKIISKCIKPEYMRFLNTDSDFTRLVGIASYPDEDFENGYEELVIWGLPSLNIVDKYKIVDMSYYDLEFWSGICMINPLNKKQVLFSLPYFNKRDEKIRVYDLELKKEINLISNEKYIPTSNRHFEEIINSENKKRIVIESIYDSDIIDYSLIVSVFNLTSEELVNKVIVILPASLENYYFTFDRKLSKIMFSMKMYRYRQSYNKNLISKTVFIYDLNSGNLVKQF